MSCAVCNAPLLGHYFEIRGQKTCHHCHEIAYGAHTRSGAKHYLRACACGILAGGAGYGIWSAALALTGYQLGVIGILVGFMVGVAVRTGSGRRGGRLYQATAAIITYGAIVTSYVPLIVAGFQSSGVEAPDFTAQMLLMGIAWVLAWALPFFALPRNLLGLVIIMIAIYQAWRINRPRLAG